jgi:hypothetical protein
VILVNVEKFSGWICRHHFTRRISQGLCHREAIETARLPEISPTVLRRFSDYYPGNSATSTRNFRTASFILLVRNSKSLEAE